MIVISRLFGSHSLLPFFFMSNKLIIDERLSDMSVVPFSLSDSDLKVRTVVKSTFYVPQS